ncbi:putative disease resistance RPP13-like protein 1 isoform X2 [Cicer arietinum]|uniref:putative disease resistance RPP13-like protein 1 isoform X2 n=1 Tax=Cicer arietinum TaxID=3827 RepID=UPI003CC5B35B
MAVEFVGSALLSASLQVAFDRLASSEVVEYFQSRKFNEKLLNRLNIMLLSINVVVDDAEQKQIINRHVKAWLDAVKDAVFDAEDLLDEIDIEVSRCKREVESQSSPSKVWNFFNVSFSSFDKEIESKMQEVLDNLEFLASKKDILGLKESSSGFGVQLSSQVSRKLPSTSLLGETVLYGRDIDREIIFDWMISENENHFSIVSIVGMGGMGKTLLAQHLYNDSKMEDEFDIKAWVCISDDFDVFMVTRAILEGINRSTDDSRDLNMVQERLKEKLTGKRFLLVLDDVWNEKHDQWETLQTPFKYGAQESKIIVTTRSLKVASTIRSTHIHQLEQLKEEHSWLLFAKHAFQDENPQLNPELKEIGKKITGKCKGLPLALKTIGSLLYTKSSLVEWEIILASEIWDLPEENKSMEEVGEQYFDDLLSRSFFQQSSEDKTCFVMHDLLSDLAKYICGDFCFRLEVEEAQNISKVTRHFSFLRNRYDSSKRFEALCKAERLRSFLPYSRKCNLPSFLNEFWMSGPLVNDLLPKFKLLRVLSLSGYYNMIEVPDTIGNLKHLRYLDLSDTNIKKLPDSICFLFNLQILKLKNCRFLDELPLNFHQLTNMRYLDFSGTKVRNMPIHFGKLKNLQVLNSFCVGKGNESNIQQLGELNLHGTLSISELQNIVNPFDALAANLKNKIHLVKLELEWNANNENSQQEREVLEKLQPSKHLKELSVISYGGTRFPDWFGDSSLSNLVSLKLSNCEKFLLLPPLGTLPSLKKLCIIGLSGVVVIGSEFYGSSSSNVPFSSLETLQFEDMVEWEEWECKTATNAFPFLQKLSIKNCPNLRYFLPEKLPFLTMLEISHCEQLVASIPRTLIIRELDLNDCGKLQFDYHPATLKIIKIGGYNMELSLLERIEPIISNISLERIKITDCPNMNIPLHCCYNFLVGLYIWNSCDSLTTFPLDLFPKLKELQFRDCINLEMISQSQTHNLKLLQISNCSKFVSFPRGGLNAPELVVCEFYKLENLKSLPECMQILLPSMCHLFVRHCPKLELLSGGGLPSNLKQLHLRNCSKLLASMKRVLATTTSLFRLYIGEVDVECFPDQGLLPHSLTALSITWCPNLKKLNYNGLCHLSSLTTLYLSSCPLLQCLPEEGLPKSISTLQIWGDCSLLKPRFRKSNGEDWEKIRHIPCIIIDSDIIT